MIFHLSSEESLLQNIEEHHLKVIKEQIREEECQNQWVIAVIIVEMLHQEVQIKEVDHHLITEVDPHQIIEEDHHLIKEGYLHLQISEVDHILILENLLLLIIEECLLLHLNIEECLLQIIGGLLQNMEEVWIQEDYHLKN